MTNPVVALANVRGTAVRLVSNANCVAVNRRLVCFAMNAVSATVPSPTPKYSRLAAAARAYKLLPILASAA